MVLKVPLDSIFVDQMKDSLYNMIVIVWTALIK